MENPNLEISKHIEQPESSLKSYAAIVGDSNRLELSLIPIVNIFFLIKQPQLKKCKPAIHFTLLEVQRSKLLFNMP